MLAIFTDLDGTLLDESGSVEEALPSLRELSRHRVPVVFCTSKTRAEVEALRREVGNEHPFIVENGGATVIPSGYFGTGTHGQRDGDGHDVIEYGDPYPSLLLALGKAAIESCCPVRAFHQMGALELAARAHIQPRAALLALRREYDEPFDVLDPDRTGALLRAIERQGKRWTRGGDFYHILGRNDKGRAVRALLDLYRKRYPRVTTVGMGDGPNDAGFLAAMDVAWVMRSRFQAELLRRLPGARLSDSAGPAGWAEAVASLQL